MNDEDAQRPTQIIFDDLPSILYKGSPLNKKKHPSALNVIIVGGEPGAEECNGSGPVMVFRRDDQRAYSNVLGERSMRFKSVSIFVFTLLLGQCAFAQEEGLPKVDVFFGYSFLRVNSAQQIPAFTANGGVSTLGLNFTDHIGLEAEFGGYFNGNINNLQLDTTSFSYLFGPRVSYGRTKKFDPYFHTLFGVNRASTSVAASSILIPMQHLAPGDDGRFSVSQVNFAMAVGGGIDIRLSKHVLLRPVQIDYYLTRFETPTFLEGPGAPTTNKNQNNIRFAAGVAFSFGGDKAAPVLPPAPPKMKPCRGGTSVPIDAECPKESMSLNISANPAQICPGAISRVTAGVEPDGAVNQWVVNGEQISSAPVLEFGATGHSPGAYKVILRVTADGYNEAQADATVTVRSYLPPSGTLSVSPSEIYVGDKATLSANFSPGQCGGTLGPVSYSSPEGAIQGNQFDSAGVRFDPAGPSEQRKTIAITAKVSDERGSGSAGATVVVKERAAVAAKRLPDVIFPKGSDRVNNCGKRVLLEELKSLFESDPTGKVVFVGHISENENPSGGLDQRRALNAAAVISAGQGICARFPASQILVNAAGSADNGVDFQPHFCEASAGITERPGQSTQQSDNMVKFQRVEVWFVPTGGTLPVSAKGARDASSLGVSSLGCPR
jgi:hypothetical protein